ncbi:hypothetical protein GOBAR_DD07506 [Gossypium barbadense]|nr:hypothetical protein GOBAR_DD07506 [Gossypium barbadense]
MPQGLRPKELSRFITTFKNARSCLISGPGSPSESPKTVPIHVFRVQTIELFLRTGVLAQWELGSWVWIINVCQQFRTVGPVETVGLEVPVMGILVAKVMGLVTMEAKVAGPCFHGFVIRLLDKHVLSGLNSQCTTCRIAWFSDECKKSAGIVLNNCRLAFGAYGTKHSIRARNVEEFLFAKLLNFGVIYEAIKLLESTIIPEKGTSSPAYRTSLAVGFLFEFLSPLMNSYTDISRFCIEAKSCILLPLKLNFYFLILERYFHFASKSEAVYEDDIPSPRNCLHGAFIYSTEPLARGLRPYLVLNLYADELTQCAGQRIALVVADTQKNADMAAKLAVVDYDKKNLEPILSVEEAFEKCSFYEVPPLLNPEPVGAFSKGMAKSDHQMLSAELSRL